jgi:hypothetical protein
MQRFLLTVLTLVSASFGQDALPRTATIVVRNINVHTDLGLPQVALHSLFEAWKGKDVGLYTQLKTTPELLAQAADRAGLTIQSAFAQAGRAVVVSHEIDIVPPLNRYVEVRFSVALAPSVQ